MLNMLKRLYIQYNSIIFVETIKNNRIMKYKVDCIQWDTDDEEVDLPKELTVTVPDGISEHDDVLDYIGDRITEMTDFCHFGFNITPEK